MIILISLNTADRFVGKNLKFRLFTSSVISYWKASRLLYQPVTAEIRYRMSLH
jgi:hypothetical protein